MRGLALAMIVALATGALGACGGDDSESDAGQIRSGETATDQRPTRAEFIRRADALCAKFRPKTDRIEQRADNESDPDRRFALVNQFADERDRLLDSLDHLGTPRNGNTAALRAYKKVGREQVRLVRRAAEAFEAGYVRRATTLIGSGRKTGAQLRGIARRYGFKVCGAGGR